MQLVALGSFLKECPYVKTLGVRPQFSSYTPAEISLLKASPVVLFPTQRYVGVFQASSKPTFPSPFSYHFRKWRISQWNLASYFDLPRIKTVCYSRSVTTQEILDNFSFPVRILGLKNDRSPGLLLKTKKELVNFLSSNRRMIIVQEEPQRIIAKISLLFLFYRWVGLINVVGIKNVPISVLERSSEVIRKAQIDDIAVDWILTDEGWLFSGMNYPPLSFYSPDHVPVNRKKFLCETIREIATEWDWGH